MAARGDVKRMVQALRAVEYYPWYDSVVVGPGANDLSTSWFNTFQDFANADKILFFRGNGRTVGESYSDNANERLDFALTIYGAQIDFFAPLAQARFVEDPIDLEIMPFKWLHDLPQRMAMKVKIAGTDELFTIPACKIPSGSGAFNPGAAGLQLATNFGGLNGLPLIQNMWVAPEPFELPANQTLVVEAKIDVPLKGTLQSFSQNPGFNSYPTGVAGAPDYREPIWYAIRFTWHGAAHRQLRAARSAAGATGK